MGINRLRLKSEPAAFAEKTEIRIATKRKERPADDKEGE
jgi:hypothetical protein